MTKPTDEITAAHDDVVRARARVAETVSQIEARVTGQMDTVKAKLDVVQMIRDNPWTALALATGLGAAIAATGADAKATEAAAAAARQGATKARDAGAAAVDAARAAPGAAQAGLQTVAGGLRDQLDHLAASAVLGIVERLRREDAAPAPSANPTPPPDPRGVA